MKYCSYCKQEKNKTEFGISKQRKDGLNIYCKVCVAEKCRIFRKKNPENYRKTSEKYRNSEKFKKLQEEKAEKKNEYQRQYYINLKLNNPEKLYSYRKKYYKSDAKKNIDKRFRENNKEKIQQYEKRKREKFKERIAVSKKQCRLKKIDHYRKKNREIHKNRLKSDPQYRFICGIRNLIGESIRKMNYTKNSTTYEILGCEFDFFKSYIESKFTKGMNWDNRGIGEDKWQLDHIIPISSAKTQEEVIKLNHYTNFQPLWSEDNLRKSNKLNYEINYGEVKR